MEHILIVDGYNVIGAWPELKRLADTNLEDARDRLIEMLADYQGFSGARVILVFDAHQVPGLGGAYSQYRLDIQYTKEKETADERIERLVTQLINRRRQIHVATSDQTEQHVIFGKGALRKPARELLIELEENRKLVAARVDEQRQMSKKKNLLIGGVSTEMLQKLEQWRRGKPKS
ncbi:NYN domain-containing protein [Xylanibacillus composti]|uniref:NYN domain-containing protein n=1 Tax=Xylanibacillus composti TaxID=1572762 RepID=A0A8J4H677_9BACL|nr:NYN domain-containing protein [Xylanibacillus composti]MDT9727070.1 NYN domain-containing protein [Xylanibacillus composti]GIQ70336.1 hypothetical protein XYCOK13_31600 [Xylanibacillus composti]